MLRRKVKRSEGRLYGQPCHFLQKTGCLLPLSVRGIVRVSKFAALFPDFRGPSLAAKAAADLRTLIPTIATVGRRLNNTLSDSLMKE